MTHAAGENDRELNRADEKRMAEEWLEAKLMEGLNSAERDLTAAAWRDLRQEALSKVDARKQ
jgi:antitoxin ParD1/3/4